MKLLKNILVTCLLTTSFSVYAEDNKQSLSTQQKDLMYSYSEFYFQMSPNKTNNRSDIYGLAFQGNTSYGKFFTGFHALAQIQDTITNNNLKDFIRYGLGVSLNYQTGMSSKFNFGLKYIYYFGNGKISDALDCLQCSNVYERYSGVQKYFTFAFKLDENIIIRFDKPISKKFNRASEKAYDPYYIGPQYYYENNNIPEPSFIFNITYQFE